MRNTGALKNTKDNRDILYKDVATAISTPSERITDISMIPVLNQGMLGTCVAHAISVVKMYQEYKETGSVLKFSRRFLYSNARKLSPYTGEGLYPRDGAKAVNNNGILEPDTIDDNTLSHLAYSSYTPSQIEVEESKKYTTGYTAVEANDVSLLKSAIIKEGVITLSLDYAPNSWNTGTLTKPISPISLHYIAVYGYTDIDNDTIFYFRNSWGEDWGDKGNGAFKWSDYQNFVHDIMVFTDVPNELIQKAKTTNFIFKNNLKFGMSSPDVSRLQERLRDEGYFTYPTITGYFGTVTRDAVIRYQKANNIYPPFGYVGMLTRTSLNKVTEKDITTKLEIPFKQAPFYNKSTTPKTGFVLHGTLGAYNGAVEWLLNPNRKYPSSAHYVIGRNEGEVIQLVKNTDVAWHAGIISNPDERARNLLKKDILGNYKNPNDYTIGIEFAWGYDINGDGVVNAYDKTLTDWQIQTAVKIIKDSKITNPTLLSHQSISSYKSDDMIFAVDIISKLI